MPFTKAPPPHSYSTGPAVPTDGVCISARPTPHKKTMMVIIEIGPTLADRLNVQKDCMADVYIGDGENAGQLKILLPARYGEYKVRRQKVSRTLKIVITETNLGYPVPPMKRLVTPYEVEEGALVVTVLALQPREVKRTA